MHGSARTITGEGIVFAPAVLSMSIDITRIYTPIFNPAHLCMHGEHEQAHTVTVMMTPSGWLLKNSYGKYLG